jgi:hypothetical protein
MNRAEPWSIAVDSGIMAFVTHGTPEHRGRLTRDRTGWLEPIEGWLDEAGRLFGTVAEDLSAITGSTPWHVGYAPQDRIRAARELGRGKKRVLGLLDSSVPESRESGKVTADLRARVDQLGRLLEDEYVQSQRRVTGRLKAGRDPRREMMALFQTSVLAHRSGESRAGSRRAVIRGGR